MLVLSLVLAGAALASGAAYQLGATRSCLVHGGLSVSVEPKISPALQRLAPYGSNGGLIWFENSSGTRILIEFGKNAGEAASMRAAVIKLFGRTAGSRASATRGNVTFYTNHLQLTSHEIATVDGCLH
jgi:hypothetical protein